MPKKTIELNARLKWLHVPDEYVVWQDEHAIGRIRRGAESDGQGSIWEWYISIPMQLPEWASGTAESRDACMKAFSVAWAGC